MASAASMSLGVGSYKVEAKGIYGLITLLVFLVVAAVATIQWTLYNNLRTEIQSVRTEIKIMSYVLSQPPDKRPRLLAPVELRERTER